MPRDFVVFTTSGYFGIIRRPSPGHRIMQKKPKQRPGKRASNVKRVSPNKPEARDEGPRLIPLGNEYRDAKTEYYLRLSNLALGLRDKKS